MTDFRKLFLDVAAAHIDAYVAAGGKDVGKLAACFFVVGEAIYARRDAIFATDRAAWPRWEKEIRAYFEEIGGPSYGYKIDPYNLGETVLILGGKVK